MRLPLLLGFIWALLLAIGLWAANRGSRTDVIVEAREQAHQRFAELPEEEFLRDRANVFSGRVSTVSGEAVEGAEVRIMDLATAQGAAAAAEPGSWPEIPAEATARTGPGGRYELRDLAYGHKQALVIAPGFHPAYLKQISFADGYGASGMDAALQPADEREISVVDAAGEPQPGLEVRLLPSVWGLPEVRLVTDAGGTLTIPASADLASAPLRLLAGDPPLQSLLPDAAAKWTLRATSPLRMEVPAAADGDMEVMLLPAGLRHLGGATRQLSVSGGALELPALWHGPWQIVARQGELVGQLHFDHDGSQVELPLRAASPLRVQVTLVSEAAHGAQVAWQSIPFASPAAFDSSPFSWCEAADPTRIIVATDEFGIAVIPGAGRMGGWLMALAPNHPPSLLRLGGDQVAAELRLSPAVEVSVRTDRPYLPVELEARVVPKMVALSDAAAECYFLTMRGQVVARSGFSMKGRSYPKGYWAGRGVGALRFSLLDDRGRPRGCVYGFVTDHEGAPFAGAEVFLQGADGRPQRGESDEHGFYRFTGLSTGAYAAFARPSGDTSAWWQLEGCELTGVDGEEEGEARLDLTIHPCALEVRTGEDAVWELEIQNQQGERLTGGAPDAEGSFRVSCLPAGSYRILARSSEEDPGRPVGEFELVAGRLEPLIVEAGQ